MPDTQLSQLLDRAVQEAPPMHLDGATMLAAGRGRVRRRRAVGAGGVLGVVALAGALWFAPGGPGTPTGLEEIRPATTVWEQGETVEGTLFTGLQTVDQEQVAHSYVAELSRTSGEGPVTLVLSDGGDVVEEIRSSTPVPGLDVFEGERMTVAVWREPEGVTASVPLVGPVDPGGPADVQHAEVGGEEVAYAVWSADVVPLPEEVVDVYLVGGRDRVVALSGAPVQSVKTSGGPRRLGKEGARHRMTAFADAERGVLGHLVDDEDLVLVQLGGSAAQVFTSGGVSADGVERTVAVLPVGAEVEGAVGAPDDVYWSGTRLLDRPVVLVVRYGTAGDGPADLTFTLGGRSWTLSSYAQDLRELELADGTTVALDPRDGGLALVPAEVAGTSGEDASPLRTLEEASFAPGLATQHVKGSLVTVFTTQHDESLVLTESRLEVMVDGVPRWVEPTDVAQGVLGDGRLVTLLTLDAEEGIEVTGVGRQVGDHVERWDRAASGTVEVGWSEVDGELVPTWDGVALRESGEDQLGARLFALPEEAGMEVVVLPAGLGPKDTVVPLLRKGDSLDPAPGLLDDGLTQVTPAGPVRAVELEAGMLSEGARLAVRHSDGGSGAANTWGVLGTSTGGHLVIDPGLVVTVGGDTWLFYRQGDDSPGTGLRAGLVGKTLLEQARPDDPSRYDLAAVLPGGSEPDLLLGPGARLHSTQSHDGPVEGLQVWTASVSVPDGVSPADAVRGLDHDGDGEPDLRLPFRG